MTDEEKMNNIKEALDDYKQVLEVKYNWTVQPCWVPPFYNEEEGAMDEGFWSITVTSKPKPHICMMLRFREDAFADMRWWDVVEKLLVIRYIEELEK